MTITHVGTFANVSANSATITTVNVGDVVPLFITYQTSKSVTAVTASSGRITFVKQGSTITLSSPAAIKVDFYLGTVVSTGSTTVTLTVSSGLVDTLLIDQYHSSLGGSASWSIDGTVKTQNNTSNTHITWVATGAPTNASELFVGYGLTAGTPGTTGSPAGSVATADSVGTGSYMYNLAITATQTPTCSTSSGASWAIGALLTDVAAGPTGIAFRSASSAAASGFNPVPVTKPTGCVNGDLLIAFMSCGSSGGSAAALTGPAGWADLGAGGVDGNTGNVRAFSKVAASEGSSWSWTKGASPASCNATVSVLCFSTPDSASPVDVTATFGLSTTASLSVVAPDITTTRNNDILVCAFMANAGGGTFTPPAGMTERTDQAQGTTNYMSTATEDRPTAGATGTRTATEVPTSTAQKWVSCSIAVAGESAATIIALGVASQVATSAFTIGRLKTRVLGAVSVAVSAFAVTFHKGLAPIVLGTATVTTAAYAIARLKTRLLGTAAVTVTAYPVSRLKTYLLGAAASVTATAYAIGRLKTRLLGSPVVAVTAYPITRSKVSELGTASVAVTAYGITFAKEGNIKLGTATVAVTAYPIGFSQQARIWDITKWFRSRTPPSNKWSEKQR